MACSVGLKVGQPETAEHFWPLALGPRQNSSTNAVLPPSLNKALSWSWHHPGGRYHTTIAGGPVIDSDKNLYLQTNDGTRKFSPDGKTLWHYQPLGDTNNEPSLMGDYVFGNTNNVFAYALDRHKGIELWSRKYAENAGGDVGYPGAHEGVYVMGVDSGTVKGHEGGNARIIGIEAMTGNKLWEYHPEWPSWNFMPLFPGDGTLLFMDFTGGAYRLGLRNGTEIWHTAAPGTAKLSPSFGDGGMTVGANGIAYTCSNPGAMGGNEGTQGVLRAYRASDGKPLWGRILPQPCNSWPAVGRLGSGPELSVVVTPGSFMGSKVMHGGIMAFNAESGRLIWNFQAPPYSHFGNMAMGDLEGFLERSKFDH